MPLETSNSNKIGCYDLLQKIADGGMGTVHKGRHAESGDIVAIKVVPPHQAKNSIMMKRFEQEYNACRTIDHPNIIRALDFGHDGGSAYLVMEYVEGESLGQRLGRVHRLPESEALEIIVQVAQGLQRAHKLGLVHRDVKPDNILLTRDNQVKLADLGLVKEIEAELNLTRTGRGLGTPHFMAPEQFRNAKNADARCDIYSLGATLYMMVTGELPFDSCAPLDAWMKKIHNELAPARDVVPDVSERIDWAIRRAMSPDPNQRPGNCREFIEDLTGHSTRKLTPILDGHSQENNWYLLYNDDAGVVHTVKGSMEGIRRSLKEGLLGDAGNVRASRNKAGPFESLRAHPEFRDLVVEPLALSIAMTPPPAARATPPVLKTPVPSAAPALMPETAKAKSEPVTAPVPLPAPRRSDYHLAPEAPHINLGPIHGGVDWVKWFTITVVAIASAIGGYYLIPIIIASRLFW